MLGFFQSDERAFSPDACELWQTNRIPHSPLSPRTRFQRWGSTDSEENYLKRGNKDFTVESVGYEFNSFGYRGPEFKLAPGEVGVMFLGDSNTFGLGMPWDHLWTSVVARRLQQLWEIPVRPFNLAWSATGSDYTAMMIHQTVEVLRPVAVCVLWPFIGRMTWYPNPKHQVHFIPECTSEVYAENHAAYLRLASESHGFFNFVRNFHLVNEKLIRLGIPYYWGHLEQFSDHLLSPYVPLDRFVGTWHPVDLARDARHAGIQTHQIFADRVVKAVARDPGYKPALRQQGLHGLASRGTPTHIVEQLLGIAPRSFRRRVAEWQLAWRIRAIRRKDPFIY